jgi:hypothetical protein
MWMKEVGVGVASRLEDTPIERHRRVIQADRIGHMHGAYAIVLHLSNASAARLST